MRVVHLSEFPSTQQHDKRLIVYRFRLYVDGRWSKNGFLTFNDPHHPQDAFERAYIEFSADAVYMQPFLSQETH